MDSTHRHGASVTGRGAAAAAAPHTLADRQDIRLAVVMNGGVSLAVWMSGVTNEMNRLVAAGRGDGTAGPAYRALLDMLVATATIDVIAGTSAGGINAGFLAVGISNDRSLDALGRLWADRGGLEDLLRDPLQSDPPSLLRGDDYFLPSLTKAYQQVLRETKAGYTGIGATDQAVELYLTGTLYSGRRSRFADDMGAGIDEIDYGTTFFFGNDACPEVDLHDEDTMLRLAVASRCTSSFPGAFEPHFVGLASRPVVDDRGERRWLTEAGLATFDHGQYVVDGGVLQNRPIRPALEAIYRQPAGLQVRRVLAYVAPTPGTRADPVEADDLTVPRAENVVLSVLTRLRSTDSVSRELTEIRRTNERVGERRRTRSRLVAAMTRGAGALAGDPALWQGYLDVRRRTAARNLAELIVRGAADSFGWSVKELADAMLRRPDLLSFVPSDATMTAALARTDADWTWGQTTVERLGAIALDVFKRAMVVTPLGDDLRGKLADHRARLHDVLADVRQTRWDLNEYWSGAAAGGQPRTRDIAGLDTWMETILRGWRGGHTDRPTELYAQALAIAGVLAAARDDLARQSGPVAAMQQAQQDELTALTQYLFDADLPPAASRPDAAPTTPGRDILCRMLMLDVVHVSLAGTLDQVEQEVELVQVSSLTPELLTAVQAHHFGAFYRRSWRMNDWLRGRIDGSTRLCQILLSPARLIQLGHTTDQAVAALRAVAVGSTDAAERAYLQDRWNESAAEIQRELAFLDEARRNPGTVRVPAALPRCAAAVALRVQLEYLRAELAALARATRAETSSAPVASWVRDYEVAVGQSGPGKTLESETALTLVESSSVIGRQRLENEVGTDEFARLGSQAVAVAATLVSGVRSARPARAVLRAVRGYALILWIAVRLATSRGRFGPRIVGLAVTLGAAAIAVSLVAPGVPLLVMLLGGALVLAGATTGALLRPPGRPVGKRLLLPAVVAVALLAAVGWAQRDLVHLALLIKAGAVVGLIGLGSYIGGVRRPGAPEQKPTMSPAPGQKKWPDRKTHADPEAESEQKAESAPNAESGRQTEPVQEGARG